MPLAAPPELVSLPQYPGQGGSVVPTPAGQGGVTVGQLNKRNADYEQVYMDWARMTLLYEGGYQIKQGASNFLVRRPRELQEVYFARIERVSYHNILGTCFGWYHAALFKNPPIIQIGTVDENGKPNQGTLDPDIDTFYNNFRKDCDRRRTPLVELTRELWTNLALYSCGWVLIDLPDPAELGPSDTLFEQKKSGAVANDGKPIPHLLSVSPISVSNWGADSGGILEWAIMHTTETRGGPFEKPKQVDVWIYFTRTEYARYEYEHAENEKVPDDGKLAKFMRGGPHALSKQQIVPLLRFEVPSSLWLANRAYLPIVDHFNADNAYGWALYMANLAMPVIISDDDITPTLSEAGFIRLRSGSSYEWTEPTGTSFVHAANRVEELRQECFRLMYLIYQGRTSNATADGSSGLSKEMDMMPAQDVMNEYGDVIVAATQRILDMVAMARGDKNVRADVRGMKFGKTATLEQIQKTEAVLALAVPSDTFVKEVYKQGAAEYLPDANPETLEKIMDEIAKSPSLQAQMAAMQQQRVGQYQNSIQGSLAQFTAPPPPPKPISPRIAKRSEKIINQ